MNHKSSFLLAMAALLSACGTMDTAKVDNRDFAVDTYYPASNEIQLAERRARHYWHIIVDTPSRGRVVRVADYMARYIGTGG